MTELQGLNDLTQAKTAKAGLFSKIFNKAKKKQKKPSFDDTNIDYSPKIPNLKQKINQIISKPLTLQVTLFLL